MTLASARAATLAAGRPLRLPIRVGVGYGVGMIGERMFRDAPALLLLIFMTNYLAIPAAWAGMAVFLPKLLLVFIDPYLGYLSDTYTGRHGRRRPFLVAGAILSGAAFVLMFNVPTIANTGMRTLYMTLLIGASFSVYSIYSVPYLALASDIARDPYERTRLLAFRMAFLAVGLNLSASAGVLIEHFGGGVNGYHMMALAYGAICMVTMLVPALTLSDEPLERKGEQRGGWLAALRPILADTAYLRLLLANLLQKASEGVGYGSFAYFFLFWLQQPLSVLSACVVASTSASILTQPLWVMLSKRQPRWVVCSLAIGGYILCNSLWLTVPEKLFWPVPVLGFFAGTFGTGLLLAMVAMMSDIAVKPHDAAAQRHEGLITGIWLAVEKIGFAAGALLVGLSLSAFGFVESTAGTAAPQSHRALIGIAFTFAGVASILYLLTLLLVMWVGKARPVEGASSSETASG